ncbi:hypothetical protein NQ314_013506 [Rhamnusium bicolor]|uniref:Uncharacterized protein n=1 Tax=Rhamnusium bicolor TaxID=1586634 RepID=A0AAV8X6G0_9CUCU|nr:hypothetical protein NQ314_013506 [Rhamnusium bicolor]
MNKPLLKWSPATPIRTPDNLISSGAREKKQLGFIPTYENETCQQMEFIMSNEYMRMWFKERSKYEKDTYTREQIIKEESRIKRRIYDDDTNKIKPKGYKDSKEPKDSKDEKNSKDTKEEDIAEEDVIICTSGNDDCTIASITSNALFAAAALSTHLDEQHFLGNFSHFVIRVKSDRLFGESLKRL